MSALPDEKINEVRERAAIHDVVADYVSLRKAGANFQGLCPFHGEKTPSFNVNPGRGIFHCFGCGVGGDVFAFVMKIEGIGFIDAVKFLARRTGVVIEERPLTVGEKRKADERETLLRINDIASGFYRKVLTSEPAGSAGRAYIGKRGVPGEVAEAYRLGFAPDSWESLTRYLEQRKVPLAEAEKLGLIRRRDGGGYYDTFRNRLLFVIGDTQGRPVAFGGRVLDDSLPKYINSPESPVYRKGDVLFGLDLAKQALREKGWGLVVEGYFDHLALYRAGIRNVVATCGTALTESHLRLLRRYAEKIYLLFDGDAAGKNATMRAVELFLAEGVPGYAVDLPAGDDPDTFLAKNDAPSFLSRVEKAKPLFEYFVRETIRSGDAGSVDGRVRIIEEILPRLAKIGNVVERENYLAEVARLLDVNVALLRRRMANPGGSGGSPEPPRKSPARSASDPEEMLLALMGKYGEVARKVRDFGSNELFRPEYVPLAEEIIRMSEGGEVDWPRLLALVEPAEERSRLAALFVADAHLENIDSARAFEDCRLARERSPLAEMKGLKQELGRLDPEDPRYWEIMKRLDSLRNRKSRLC
jgi:DNA primase